MVVSGLLAMVRGFASEILSILAWVVAALAALLLYPLLIPLVQAVAEPYWLALAISAAGIFGVVYIAISALTYRWTDRAHGGEIGFLDRSLGFIFGVFRGLLVVAIAFLLFTWLVPEREDQPDWIAGRPPSAVGGLRGWRAVFAGRAAVNSPHRAFLYA